MNIDSVKGFTLIEVLVADQMYRVIRDRKGFTLIEVLVAMLLMGILGTLVMNFMINGSSFYKKVYTDYDTRNQARQAVHYISSRTRENDSMGAITVKDNSVIISKKKANVDVEVDTISYNIRDKKLYEEVAIISDDSKTLVPTSKRKIADVSSFEVKIEEASITMIIGYEDSSKVIKTYKETLTLRSYN